MTLPTSGRCPAAHREDSSPCVSPADAVVVVGMNGTRVAGCVELAATMLASVTGTRVYPGSVTGAAVDVWRAAQDRKALDLLTRPAATR